MSGAPFAVVEMGDTTLSSQTSIWPAGTWVMWTSQRSSPHNDYYLWRTQDYSSVLSGVPPTWAGMNFVQNGFAIGGAHFYGVSYFGVVATWPGEIGDVWNIGYSKSSDNGATWSLWTKPTPDWRSVPGIAGSIYDDWFGPPYSFDMIVDAQNRVHFFGVLQDTLTGARAIVEIYETASGWNSQFVTRDLKPSTVLPVGHSVQAATSQDGIALAVKWLNAPAQGHTQADIWISLRAIGGQWSYSDNISHTPDESEIYVTMAPTFIATPPAIWTYLVKAKQVSPTTVYFFGRPFVLINGGVEGDNNLTGFSLEQNYPNPFNPVTNFQFSIANRQLTILKVYDLLGREVARLVNEVKEPGSHTVTWDASRQGGIPSGVYFYRLTTPDGRVVRKAVLMK